MWDDLSNGIKATIVNAIGTTVNGIKATRVLEYEPNTMDGFPFISIAPAEAPAEIADTRRNKRQYTFAVKAYQERKQIGAEKAERVLRQLNDELIQLFDSTPYLYGDLIHGRGWVQPIPSQWAYITTDQVDVRVSNILLVCEVIQ